MSSERVHRICHGSPAAMLLIPCPYCGARDQTEFSYGGDAAVRRPADPSALSDDDWSAFLHLRGNPAGEHDELWQHAQGCRRWIVVRRNTLTHAIVSGSPVGTAASPDPAASPGPGPSLDTAADAESQR